MTEVSRPVEDPHPGLFERFVGVNIRDGGSYGFLKGDGHLYVGPGFIECRLNPRTARLAGFKSASHVGRTIQVYRPRLLPVLGGTSLRIDDECRIVFVRIWGLGMRRLIRCIISSGFEVEQHRSWIFAGFRYFGRAPS